LDFKCTAWVQHPLTWSVSQCVKPPTYERVLYLCCVPEVQITFSYFYFFFKKMIQTFLLYKLCSRSATITPLFFTAQLPCLLLWCFCFSLLYPSVLVFCNCIQKTKSVFIYSFGLLKQFFFNGPDLIALSIFLIKYLKLNLNS
jgi:hypothetical protein